MVKVFYIHTGNIVNSQNLKQTVALSATEELAECLKSTIDAWYPTINEKEIKLLDEACCKNEKFSENMDSEERSELKITVKIFLNSLRKDSISEAINKVFCELNVVNIETVIISLPDLLRTESNLQILWEELESLVKESKVFSLGISDLNKDQLERLYIWAQEKPAINQVNLSSCCTIPEDMTNFASENRIQLLTHNDPPEILTRQNFAKVLENRAIACDNTAWQPEWVARYSVLIKARGIIKSKGFICKSVHDARL